MFLGHIAAGLAATRVEPRLKPGTAILAAQLPDAIWPWLVVAGVEHVRIAPGDTVFTPLAFDHYPWSHSLVMAAAAGAAMAAICRGLGRRAGLLIAALAVSHWVLDVVSHRPDVPLLPFGGPKLGLGLWNHFGATVAVELAALGVAVALLVRARAMTRGLAGLVLALLVAFAGNALGPPPPSVAAVVGSLIVVVPLVTWWGNRVAAR